MISEIFSDVILEGLYKLKLQDSVQLQIVLALYDRETVQHNGQTIFLRLKTAVKLFVDQMMRTRNFTVRNEVRDQKDDRRLPHQIPRQRQTKEKKKSGNEEEGTSDKRSEIPCRYRGCNTYKNVMEIWASSRVSKLQVRQKDGIHGKHVEAVENSAKG